MLTRLRLKPVSCWADTITAGTDIAEVEAAMLDLASEMDTQTVAAIFEKAVDIGGNLDPGLERPRRYVSRGRL